ncbi:hypothetical protein TNCV_1888281 [Trichonephila clavipes]|nr:hypothetical protein TNCV_1888281 [Trichonephila clavipes]
MTNDVPKREIQPFSMLSATVSARMSGIGNASIHRLYRSMIVKQKRNPSDDEKSYGKKESFNSSSISCAFAIPS